MSIVMLVILLVLNALLTVAGAALTSANQHKIKKKAEEGDQKSVRLSMITENPGEFLTAVQICSSFIGILSGALADRTLSAGLAVAIMNTGLPVSSSLVGFISVAIVTIILSYFIVVLSITVPKRIAMQKPDPIAGAAVSPAGFLTKLAKPFIWIVTSSTDFLVKLIGSDDGIDTEVTEAEIRMMVDAGGETGSIDENEMEMINNIFEFDDKIAGDICTHRTDVAAITSDAGEQEILALLGHVKYSRIPVYEDNIDNIVGILHIKDVMKYIINGTLRETELGRIMRKPYFVPFSKKTDALFKEMQNNKIHMAIVVDEYGGTLGLVTMEDLIEEIMGNIFDEHDEAEEPDISSIDASTWVISGVTELSRVSDFLGVDLPDDYDTLSGFLVGQIGRIPEEGEQPELEFNGLLFKLYKVEEKRITSVIVCKL